MQMSASPDVEVQSEGLRTLQHFFGMTLEGMCKLFFGPQVKCPDTIEDAGLSCNRPDTQVSNPETEHFIFGPKNNLYISSSVMPRKC